MKDVQQESVRLSSYDIPLGYVDVSTGQWIPNYNLTMSPDEQWEHNQRGTHKGKWWRGVDCGG